MTVSALTICGSLRQRSYNAALARQLPALAPAGLRIEPAPPFREIPIYDADLQAGGGFPEPVKVLGEALASADALIIVSPEYNWSIPGGLKNAFDWLSRLPEKPLDGKVAAIQSVTTGALGGARMQYHLRMTLTTLGCIVVGPPEIFIGGAASRFDPESLDLRDEVAIGLVRQQLANLARLAVLHRG